MNNDRKLFCCPVCSSECDDVGCNGAGVYEGAFYSCVNCDWEGTHVADCECCDNGYVDEYTMRCKRLDNN